jgi:arsenite methyltransferase
VSDVVIRGKVPSQVRQETLLWVGCIAGAPRDQEYIDKLEGAGFQSVSIEPTRIYAIEDAREFLAGKGVDVDALAPQIEGKFMSTLVRAVKPVPSPCCAPDCCS